MGDPTVGYQCLYERTHLGGQRGNPHWEDEELKGGGQDEDFLVFSLLLSFNLASPITSRSSLLGCTVTMGMFLLSSSTICTVPP